MQNTVNKYIPLRALYICIIASHQQPQDGKEEETMIVRKLANTA